MTGSFPGDWSLQRGQSILACDILLPRLIVKQSAIEHNIRRMAQYCREHGVSLAPHAKTTMAPGIIKMQSAAGAWGFTVATITQAQTLRGHGVERILIANQVVEPRAIGWLATELSRDPRFEAFILVDSLRGVSILNSTLGSLRPARPIPVLIELGEKGGRAGCRTDEEAIHVADAVTSSLYLQLTGVEGFEAVLEQDLIRHFLRRLRSVATDLARRGYFRQAAEVIVSAGSSEHLGVSVEELTGWDLDLPIRPLLRPGGYATNAPWPGYLTALEIWGAVLSRPEPKLAIVGFGRRDVPSEEKLPQPIAAAVGGAVRDITGHAKIRRLYDQHAIVELDGAELEVGEFVGCSIESPFRPAFATWRVVPLVDDEYRVVEALDVLY